MENSKALPVTLTLAPPSTQWWAAECAALLPLLAPEHAVQLIAERAVRDGDVALGSLHVGVPRGGLDDERVRSGFGELRAVPVPETVGRDPALDARSFFGLAEYPLHVHAPRLQLAPRANVGCREDEPVHPLDVREETSGHPGDRLRLRLPVLLALDADDPPFHIDVRPLEASEFADAEPRQRGEHRRAHDAAAFIGVQLDSGQVEEMADDGRKKL